ncbi:MAG: flagellar assembly protein T N-terminal domain-containing protein [Myxococcota bacterium]
MAHGARQGLGRWLGTSLLIGGLVVAGGARAAAAEEAKKVTAMGQAAIYGGDKANARDKAIADAMRKAVEQAVGTMVSSETVTENFQLLSDKIYSKARGYVRNYKITSEKEDAGAWVVHIEAEVSAGNLEKDVQGILAVLQAKNMPRVLVMVAEQNIGSKDSVTWWSGEESFGIDLGVVENTFIDSWSPKGVRFVDRQALQGRLSVSNALAGGSPNNDQVKEFAAKTGAEIVVIGKAQANDAGTLMGTKMHSIKANISLRALNLDSGDILATATESATVGHIDATTGGTKALKNVTQKAADTLLKKILARWQTEVSGPQTVSLKIAGVAKSKNLRELATFLRNEVRGVQEVRQRSYRKKVATLDVEIKGTAQALAEELEEKKFQKFSIEISEISQIPYRPS